MTTIELIGKEVSNEALSYAAAAAHRLIVERSTIHANFDLLSCANNHLQAVIFTGCSFDFQPNFRCAYFLTSIELSGCRLSHFEIASRWLTELSLSGNHIEYVDLKCPFLLSLDLSGNAISELSFLYSLPSLAELDLASNRLTALSFPPFSQIYYLNIYGNNIPAAGYRKLIPLRDLSELVFSSPQVEGLYQARQLVLGEFMSRQDEVSNAVGKNVFEEKYQASLAFYKYFFEARKKQAYNCLLQPKDCGRAVVCMMLGYLSKVNGEELCGEEILQYKEWIYPENRILSMGSGIWYE